MNTELGHFAPQTRLNAGLHLLAMSGDHETEPWARPRRTLYSTDEWIQRRMARNQVSDLDIAMDQRHEPATKWDRESFEAYERVARQLDVPDFPKVSVIADVCRDDLAIEIEAIAVI